MIAEYLGTYLPNPYSAKKVLVDPNTLQRYKLNPPTEKERKILLTWTLSLTRWVYYK